MIDIILTAYNCSNTLERTLNSIKNQTDEDFNLIIVDDCSTENIKDIIDAFEIKNINYVRNEVNVGCGMSRQVGINNSTSKYFMFCDSDDTLEPNAVEVFNKLIKDNPEYVIGLFYRETQSHKFYVEYMGHQWCHGKLYNREIFEKYNIQNKPEFSRWADDVYLNYICQELCKPTYIKDVLYTWMYTDTSVSRQEEKEKNPENHKTYLKSLLAAREHVLQYKDNSLLFSKLLRNIYLRNNNDEEEVEIYNQVTEALKENASYILSQWTKHRRS